MDYLTRSERKQIVERTGFTFQEICKRVINRIVDKRNEFDIPRYQLNEYSAQIVRLLNIMEWRCVYCGTPTILDYGQGFPPLNAMTIDHIVPVSKGGYGDIFNIACCCRSCNEQKGDLMLDEFLDNVGYPKAEVFRRMLNYRREFNRLQQEGI